MEIRAHIQKLKKEEILTLENGGTLIGVNGWYMHGDPKTGEPRFSCPRCNKTMSLKDHAIMSNGIINGIVACPCGKYSVWAKLDNWDSNMKKTAGFLTVLPHIHPRSGFNNG